MLLKPGKNIFTELGGAEYIPDHRLFWLNIQNTTNHQGSNQLLSHETQS